MEKKEICNYLKMFYSDFYVPKPAIDEFENIPYFKFHNNDFTSLHSQRLGTNQYFISDLIFNIKNNNLLLPFESFYINQGMLPLKWNYNLKKEFIIDHESGYKESCLLVFQELNALFILSITKNNPFNSKIPIILCYTEIKKDQILDHLNERKQMTYLSTFYKYYRDSSNNHFEPIVDEDEKNIFYDKNVSSWYSIYTSTYLFYFLEYLNIPSNNVIQRYPTKIKNKSEIYINAKSHYLIVNKNISRNLKNNTNFTIDEKNHKKYLSSHFRRGYLRMYKHDRFKNMQGKRLWINSTWIGPKEWIGSDNKIYKVISKENSNKDVITT